MRSVRDAVEIGVFIPPMPNGSDHHVISRGQDPDFYRPMDLRDKGPGHTSWVDAFEKIVVGLYWVLEGPVPYAFRTPDGVIRSLDAGCIKMLINRAPPALELLCGADDYIDAVRPSEARLNLYLPIKDNLIQRILEAHQ